MCRVLQSDNTTVEDRLFTGLDLAYDSYLHGIDMLDSWLLYEH